MTMMNVMMMMMMSMMVIMMNMMMTIIIVITTPKTNIGASEGSTSQFALWEKENEPPPLQKTICDGSARTRKQIDG